MAQPSAADPHHDEKGNDVFKNVYERRTPKWVDQLDSDGSQDVMEFTLRTVVR